MNGIDCATKLNSTTAGNLKSAGIDTVGRYLGNSWKGLTTDEVKAIHEAELGLFLIYETNPTYAGYFSYSKGVSDAQDAVTEAESLGAPHGVCIYFTVDYDAQPGDMGAIQEYFHGVKDGINGKYLMGTYGSYQVMESLSGSSYPPDKYYQTYAWSSGKEFSAHIYQHQNDVTLQEINVDLDNVNQDAGLWRKEEIYMPKHMIIYFTDRDFSSARIVSDKLGGCGMFCRNANNNFIHPDAKAAEHLVIIGGAEYADHPNVTNCCGADAAETAILAAKYSQTL